MEEQVLFHNHSLQFDCFHIYVFLIDFCKYLRQDIDCIYTLYMISFSYSICIFALVVSVTTQTQQLQKADTTQSKPIRNLQFKGLQLFHQVPQTFLQNQIYRFYGVIVDTNFIAKATSQSFYIWFQFIEKANSNNSFTCEGSFSRKTGFNFDLSCKMIRKGVFIISFGADSNREENQFKSNSGQPRTISDLAKIEVTGSKLPQKPEGLELDLIQNELVVKWKSKAQVTNLTFFQQTKNNQLVKKSFLLSNNHQNYKPPFVQFVDFDLGKTQVEISHATSKDGSFFSISSTFTKEKAKAQFNAIQHQFYQNGTAGYVAQPALPLKLKTGEKLTSALIFEVNVKNYFYVTTPKNIISKVKFIQPKIDNASQIIKNGTKINIQLSFQYDGTYFIEAQSQQGQSILNHPIYVGDGIPLYPYYTDLFIYPFDSETSKKWLLTRYVAKTVAGGKLIMEPQLNSDIKQKRSFLHSLLNSLRRTYNRSQLPLDEKLNQLAQTHSQDMKKHSYISSTNSQGQNKTKRAQKLNISYQFDEIIMRRRSLIECFMERILYSGQLYRQVSDIYLSVGIGVVDVNDTYISTIDLGYRDAFKQPLTKQEINKLKLDIIKVLIEGKPTLKQNAEISKQIEEWQQKQSNKKQNLWRMIGQRYNKEVTTIVIDMQYNELQKIKKDEKYLEAKGKWIGISIKANNRKQSQFPLTTTIVIV